MSNDYDRPDASDHEFTDTNVYIVHEYVRNGDDMVKMIIDDDADRLGALIAWCDRFADTGSLVGPDGSFHAANPGEEHLLAGDWYLTKHHGVGVSHGFGEVFADE